MEAVLEEHGVSHFTGPISHPFMVFMDDHASAATTYDALFKFLHEKYSPRCGFGPVYLSKHSIDLATDTKPVYHFIN